MSNKYLISEELLFELMASAAMAGLTTKDAPKGSYIDFYEAEKKARELLDAGPVPTPSNSTELESRDMSDEACGQAWVNNCPEYDDSGWSNQAWKKCWQYLRGDK